MLDTNLVGFLCGLRRGFQAMVVSDAQRHRDFAR